MRKSSCSRVLYLSVALVGAGLAPIVQCAERLSLENLEQLQYSPSIDEGSLLTGCSDGVRTNVVERC